MIKNHIYKIAAVSLSIMSLTSVIAPIILRRSDETYLRAISIFGKMPPLIIGAVMLAVLWIFIAYRIIIAFLCSIEELPPIQKGGNRVINFVMYGSLISRHRHTGFANLNSVPMSFQFLRSPMIMAAMAAIVGVIGTSAIDGVIQLILWRPIQPPVELSWNTGFIFFLFGLIVGSPIIETLIMSGLLELGLLRHVEMRLLTLISAVVWGIFHALTNHWLQFFSMFWLFMTFSILYLYLRKTRPWFKCLFTTIVAHIINNCLAILAILVRWSM